jgi:hypothetical protein
LRGRYGRECEGEQRCVVLQFNRLIAQVLRLPP